MASMDRLFPGRRVGGITYVGGGEMKEAIKQYWYLWIGIVIGTMLGNLLSTLIGIN